MTKKNAFTLAIACFAELLISFIVWMLKMEFNYANRISCVIFICSYVTAIVLLLFGFFFRKHLFFNLCALIPVLFCGFSCLMQLLGGGFKGLFNDIYLSRFIVYVLSVLICVFVIFFSSKPEAKQNNHTGSL